MSGICHAGPLPDYLRERHRSWHERVFAANRAWYARLADAGQHPRAMLIGCCDSRIDAVRMLGREPGDLFVVRNVASLVPPFDPESAHNGTSAAVEYAVQALRVAHIVVLGHSDCGGVRACRAMCSGSAPELEDRGSSIGRWMDILRPGHERVARAGHDEAALGRALEQEAVLTSLSNLETFPFVAAACARGALTLHGCWIEIASGALRVYDPATGRFV